MVYTKRFGSWPSFNGFKVVLENDTRLKTAIQVLVDFGFASSGEETTTSTYVPVAGMAANLPIVCTPAAVATADHDVEDAWVENLSAYAGNVIPGAGFTVYAHAPNGTWGRYLINCIG